MRLLLTYFGILLIILFQPECNGAVVFKMTNVVCDSFNKSWVTIEHCRLKAIRRNRIVFNLNLTILHPANNIHVRLQCLKKLNGLKPFLTDKIIDACQFMRKTNHPVAKIIYDLFSDFSTINHTCPYVGQQRLDGFYLNPKKLTLPVPTGEYALFLTWIFDKKPQFITNVYYEFVEDLYVNKERVN